MEVAYNALGAYTKEEIMETVPNPEIPASSNEIALSGYEHLVEIKAEVKRGSIAYPNGDKPLKAPYSDFSGEGVIDPDTEPFRFSLIALRTIQIPNFHMRPKLKTADGYLTRGPQFLSDIFIRNDIPDQRKYADMVAQHIFDTAHRLAELSIYSAKWEDPVWLNQQTGAITLNLEVYDQDLEKYLFERQLVPKVVNEPRFGMRKFANSYWHKHPPY